MQIAIDALVPLFSVLLGAGLTYWLNVRVRRRNTIDDLYQSAIAAVAIAEASKRFLQHVPSSLSNEEQLNFLRDIERVNYQNHIDKCTQARESIARLVPYDQSAIRYYEEPRTISDNPKELLWFLIDQWNGRQGALTAASEYSQPVGQRC